MEYHKKQTIKYALKAGECLLRIQELCRIEKKKFDLFLKECNIKWDKSYVYFLIFFIILAKIIQIYVIYLSLFILLRLTLKR
jgi:hypothetical protein